MWLRRIKQIVLPIVVVFCIVTALSWLTSKVALNRYRVENQVGTASLIGLIEETYPDLETSEIVQILQGNYDKNPELSSRGFEIMRSYGVLEDDWANQDAMQLAWQIITNMLLSLTLGGAILVVYFWWRDWRRIRKLNDLVKYLQDLSHQVYDLRLDENTEDELSLLTNELYKITVTLKEAAEQNRKSRQKLENALADISHQLRTPLTSLQVTIDNIYDDPNMPTKTRQDFLRLAGRQLEQMSQLVMTLLNLAKFDNGTIQMKQAKIAIGDILQKVQSNLAILADLNGIEIVLRGDLSATVSLDKHWQTEALTNIVKNAIEHSNSGGQVMVEVTNSSLFCKVSVRDSGEGITPSDRKHLFERFYKSAHSRPESVGIGLAFAKAIIEADNGQINVKSEPGTGTEFIIRYFK